MIVVFENIRMELPPGAGDPEAQMLAKALRETRTLQVKSNNAVYML
jgi:hypothetical protein